MLNVSKTTVSNYLKNLEHHSTKKKMTGGPKTLTLSDERNIYRELKKND